MSWLSNWLHPGKGYKKAGKREQAGYDEAKGMRQPFIDNATGAGKSLQDMLSKLMNPGELQNEWSKGYETSPYAKQLQDEAQSGGMDAASSMGLGGSSAALSNIQKGSANIMQKDRQNYMEDMMKKYMGAMGIGSDLYGTGANMASQGAQGAQSHGEWQGQNDLNKYNSGANKFQSLMEQAMKIAMQAATGGGSGSLPGWS